jgi:sulfur carrier protein
MNIQLNGKPQTTTASTLAQLLTEAGFGSKTTATAVNGSFVPLTLRDTYELGNGDQIEILAPMQGG